LTRKPRSLMLRPHKVEVSLTLQEQIVLRITSSISMEV
jgi:hypothetical protein